MELITLVIIYKIITVNKCVDFISVSLFFSAFWIFSLNRFTARCTVVNTLHAKIIIRGKVKMCVLGPPCKMGGRKIV